MFKDEHGLVEAGPAKIHVDPSAQPRFCKPRTVPYALKGKVEQELERLEHAGIIEPVQFADWAAPIVPVVKADGTIRICGDYKVTVNQATKVDTYPLPRIDDLLASLGRGKSFTKLDLAHAYQQIPLDEESRQYVVVNTHRGLYRYNRLPFGVSSAPSIFQRTMEGILQGIPHVCVYIDDILVTGETDQEHLETLDEVLIRLSKAGLRLKQRKCAFMQPSVEYLGHHISAEGLRPTQEKVRALAEAPAHTECLPATVISGVGELLREVPPQSLQHLSPFAQVAPEKEYLDLGNRAAGSFRGGQVPADVTLPAGTLQPRSRVGTSLRCFAIWGGRSALSPHGRWLRQANCFCLPFIGSRGRRSMLS